MRVIPVTLGILQKCFQKYISNCSILKEVENFQLFLFSHKKKSFLLDLIETEIQFLIEAFRCALKTFFPSNFSDQRNIPKHWTFWLSRKMGYPSILLTTTSISGFYQTDDHNQLQNILHIYFPDSAHKFPVTFTIIEHRADKRKTTFD